jgi:lipoyl-dependent peroxiredoxin subunit D
MDITRNETIISFFNDLGIPLSHTSLSLQKLIAVDSRFLRDLKLNTGSVLNSSHMSLKETSLLALAVAITERHEVLKEVFGELSLKAGASEAEIAETHSCVGVMTVNNVFYRFRHYMTGVDYYENQPAGLRMSSMMNPEMGKELFELMSLVISAVNGCERCVTAHENSVKQHGATEPRVFDAARLAGVIKSLCVIL